MDNQLLFQANDLRDSARLLFDEADILLKKSQATDDLLRQNQLLRQALSKNREAYNLMAESHKLTLEHSKTQLAQIREQREKYAAKAVI